MKNILVPTDFSDNAKNALFSAIDLANLAGAKLHLLHAYHFPIPYAESGMVVDYTKLETEVTQEFTKWVEAISELKNVDYDMFTIQGLFVDTIKEAIEKKDVDLIVMGTKGASGRIDQLLGTNSAMVIQHSSVPVLAIPEDGELGHLKKIALATDYGKIDDPSVLDCLVELATLYQAEVHIVNVNDKVEATTAAEAAEGVLLDHYLESVKHSYHLSDRADVAEGINEYITDNNIDVLAMMPRHHNIFEKLYKGSLTKKIAFQTKIPLLTFHA